ncbi:MAG TPA: hypothetical protein VMH30_09330 [Verrucomicrobiae bacterium]|nr:hypothetical protein [Verrucomicrobiae bacterium]
MAAAKNKEQPIMKIAVTDFKPRMFIAVIQTRFLPLPGQGRQNNQFEWRRRMGSGKPKTNTTLIRYCA